MPLCSRIFFYSAVCRVSTPSGHSRHRRAPHSTASLDRLFPPSSFDRETHDAAANVRTVSPFTPPSPSTCVYGPPASVAASTGIPVFLRRQQSIPTAAATAAAARRGDGDGEYVWTVWKFHKRPGCATRLAARPIGIQAGAGLSTEQCWCPLVVFRAAALGRIAIRRE